MRRGFSGAGSQRESQPDHCRYGHILRNFQETAVGQIPFTARPIFAHLFLRMIHGTSSIHVHRIIFAFAVERFRLAGDAARSLGCAAGDVAESLRPGIFPWGRAHARRTGLAILGAGGRAADQWRKNLRDERTCCSASWRSIRRGISTRKLRRAFCPWAVSGVAPNMFMASTTQFGREYMAFSDGLLRQDMPRQYDDSFLDRVSQTGAGEGPAVADATATRPGISCMVR